MKKRAVWAGGVLSFLVVGGSVMAGMRAPEVAGQFYPADSKELQEMVDTFLAAAPSSALEGEAVAFLSPHAGYIFSGWVEGYSYRSVQGSSLNTVIVIGSAHYFPTEHAALFDGESYQTPLGKVGTDQDLIKALLQASSLFGSNSKAHQREHSVETQLPFLQRALGSFQVVPIVMGTPDFSTCQKIGEEMATVIKSQQKQGKKILIIASSDLSHYPSDEDARVVDGATLQALLTLNPQYFSGVSSQWMKKGIPQLVCTYCGEGAVTTVMVAAKALGANKAQLLRYATSADVPYGEKERVVGYASVAFVKTEEKKPSESFTVSKETQKTLLQLARSTIEKGVEAKQSRSLDYPKEGDPILDQPAAVFVTLRKKGALRGCIGGTEARMPLGEAVQYFASAAAFEDPRFSPLGKEELSGIQIEISILSPLKRIQSALEIIPAIHGVALKRGGHGGLFLPQVWLETGWSKEVFLDQLCSQKAGLPLHCWQEPNTELYSFTVFSFEETQ